MFQNIVGKPNAVAKACVNDAITEIILGKNQTLEATQVVARYGLKFGVYEYESRMPIDAATQMARNHLHRAWKKGLIARKRRTRRLRGPGLGASKYGPPSFAQCHPSEWEMHH